MAGDEVTRNLQGMDELDFNGWNRADWHGAFAHRHTDDVVVEVKGQPTTRGIQEHIEAMKALVESTGGTPIQVASHPDQLRLRRMDLRGRGIPRRWPDGDHREMARRRHRRGVHLALAAGAA